MVRWMDRHDQENIKGRTWSNLFLCVLEFSTGERVEVSSSLAEFLEDGFGQGRSLPTIAKSDSGIVVTVAGVSETAGRPNGDVERNVEIVVYRQRTNGGSFPRIG